MTLRPASTEDLLYILALEQKFRGMRLLGGSGRRIRGVQREVNFARDFVRDFHARLTTHGCAAIRFTAGMAQWRYRMLFGTVIVAALLFIVTPIGLLLVTGDLHILIPMAMGLSLCWPLTRLMMNNTPRDYTPDRLPEELLS